MKIYGRGLWRRFLTSSAHYIRSSPVRLRPSWQLSQAQSLSSHVGGSLSKPKIGSPPQSFQGQSGLVYSVERILQELCLPCESGKRKFCLEDSLERQLHLLPGHIRAAPKLRKLASRLRFRLRSAHLHLQVPRRPSPEFCPRKSRAPNHQAHSQGRPPRPRGVA